MAGDQRDYWNQFIATVSWEEPVQEEDGTTTYQTLIGTIEARETIEGQPPGKGQPRPVYPVLRIRLETGRGVIVYGTPARLLELLQVNAPEVGDRIKIVYKGESAGKTLPGYSPAKEFEVKVQRRIVPPAAAS